MKKLFIASLLIYATITSAMNKSGGEGQITRTFINTTNSFCPLDIVNASGVYIQPPLPPRGQIIINYDNSTEVIIGHVSIVFDDEERNFVIKKDSNGGFRVDAQ